MKRSLTFSIAAFLVLSLSAQQKSDRSLPTYPTSFERTQAQEPRQNVNQFRPQARTVSTALVKKKDLSRVSPTLIKAEVKRQEAAFAKVQESARFSYKKKAVDLGGKVRLIFKTDSVWDDRTGYHLLLDADRTMFDSLDGLYRYPISDQYGAFEHVIPEGAYPALSSPRIWFSQDTIEFAPGRFDMFVVNPCPDENYFATDGRFQNVNFEGDFEYLFHVVFNPETTGDQINKVVKKDFSIVRKQLNGYFTAPIEVNVLLKNLGTVKSTPPMNAYYQINGGAIKTKTLSTLPDPGKEALVSLGTEDLSTPGKYTFKIWIDDKDGWRPLNDTLNYDIHSLAPRDIPYVEQFNLADADLFLSEWVISDVNTDGTTWKLSTDDYNESKDSRSMTYAYHGDNRANDLLISPRLNTKAGKHTLLYRAKGKSAAFEEIVVIMVNSTPNEVGAKVLDTIKIKNANWRAYGVEFNVAADGNNHIIFKALSAKNQYGLFIDEVFVLAGPASDNYKSDLRVTNVLLPYSSCDLGSAEKLKVVVKNNGIIPAKGVQVSVKLGDKSTITEDFAEVNVPVEGMATITFDASFDLSAEGTHSFATLVASDGSQSGSSPVFKASTHKLTPLTLPIDNPYFEDPDALWYSEVWNSWFYDEEYGSMVAQDAKVALISHCFNVEKDKTYRVTVDYAGGFAFFYDIFDNFEVIIGKSGTAISTWKSIGEVTDILTEEILQIDFDYTATENGSYVVGIRSTDVPAVLNIYNINIKAVSDYDVRVNNVRANVPALVPVHFLSKDGYKISTTVQNRGGKSATEVKTKLAWTTTDLGTSTAKTIEAGKSAILENPFKLTNPTTGIKEFKVSASFSQTDANPTDNEGKYRITATDTVLGSDRLIGFTGGLGSNTKPISFGTAFYVPVQDTLGAIFIGFGGKSTKLAFGLSVYTSSSTDPGATTIKVGKKILTVALERPELTAGKIVHYSLRPTILPAGTYFFELNQLTKDNIGSAVDEDPNGFFHMSATDTTATKNTTFGNVVIRPIFPKATQLITSDIGVVSIDKPVKAKDLFAANEVIEATVKNFGLVGITDSIRVRCRVGDAIKEKKIKGLDASQSATVSFEMDLSTPGDYQIMVYTGLEVDQERSNDTAKKDVTCLSPDINLFKLDFEDCADFSTTDFVPAWTTVDVNKVTTYGFKGIEFPGMGEAHAYIVMNPSLATPDLSPTIPPHGGERLGICFAEGEKNSDGILKNNDWLISPKLTLGSSSKLAFYAKTSEEYGESFQVWVSTTDNNLTSFVAVGDEVEFKSITWELFETDLSEYDGKAIHVAIQCVSEDKFTFCLDDIEVVTTVNNQPIKNDRIQLYPNPAKDFFMLYQPEMDIREVQVYDAMGRKVFGSANVETRTYRINTQGFSKGVYIVRILTADGYSSHKVVIE